MPSINISNYKRPGIYIEEYDDSVIASTTVQGTTNLVIGVSKTGPINTPVLIQNTADLTNIFGGIDRALERKGSFFHRTISQMVRSAPVYAINLLATDDTLDKIEYTPLSTTTDKENDVKREGALRRFYNTTGFWNLDTDSFLSLVSSNTNYQDRLLNFTNTSSSYITVFVFKTTATGFDRTMIDWYGSVKDLPPYVYPTDYVSDYMVDVMVVAGDFSNYQELSVDNNWSKYFDNSGLIKSQVQNFANDRNLTLLNYYQGLSFIPYFRDSNGQDVFIETVINQDTDRTGLFCAFNMDLLETDYPNGKIDLIGNNLVNNTITGTQGEISLAGSAAESVNFLSYNETLIQTIPFANKLLDTPGNVVSLNPSTSSIFKNNYGSNNRTDTYTEEYVSGVTRGGFTWSGSSASISYVLSSGTGTSNNEEVQPYAIIGGNKVYIPFGGTVSTNFHINAVDYASSSTTASYYTAIKLDTTGRLSSVSSTTAVDYPSVSETDIVLGYVTTTVKGGQIRSASVSNVAITAEGYQDLQYGNDYYITSANSNNTFVITFSASAAVPSTDNYEQYRRFKRFNYIKNVLESTNRTKSVIMASYSSADVNGWQKVSVDGMSITSVITTAQNKSISIQTNLGLTESVFESTVLSSIQDNFVLYSIDDELILSDNRMVTTNGLAYSSLTGASAYGIVAKYSDLYDSYYDGRINTGNYFYANIMQLGGSSTYTASQVQFVSITGSNYLIITGTGPNTPPFDTNEFTQFIVPDSTLNTGAVTIKSDGVYSLGYNYASYLGLTSAGAYAYLINESINEESLTNVSSIYDASTKYYLAMDLDSDNNLTVRITDSSLYTYQASNALADHFSVNKTLNVKSFESNYQQTVEVVVPDNYTEVDNQILVDASRYPEIIAGDYLTAYVDVANLEEGQKPRFLTRILSKKVYSADTSLALITCDAKIYKFPYGASNSGVYQTMRYASLDKYVDTYKGLALKGFRIRQASLPDGTETRQSAILDTIGKGTPLFNAVTNKEALDFRYLIDSFGLGLTEFSKQQLADICGERLDCLGFLNMPSMKSFRNSSSPSFVNNEGVLQTSFIATGGDVDSNPAFLYSLAEGDGATCVGYFAPYVVVNDNGRGVEVPPAMFVASTYMRKLNTNVTTTVPWTIAAGIQAGKITGIAGLEMDFNPQDIANLNQASMNPIVVKKNRGWNIETENTGLTLYKSALSYLHVRELLIELERELAAMLLQFQWKFNTQDTRSEIKLRADSICAKYASRNGLYDYYNKCDDENNPPNLIDNQIGVLDTYVEPIKGLQAIVNNITVLKTGAIQSGGFSGI